VRKFYSERGKKRRWCRSISEAF